MNKKLFRNDFVRLHGVFMSLYVLTFIVGWLRETHSFFYTIHPFIGIAGVVIPVGVYLISKNKKVIHKMIASNFKPTPNSWMRAARLSSIVIMFYYLVSIVSGMILNLALYSTAQMYEVLHVIHGVSKIVVPITVIVHVIARKKVK